MLGRRRLGRLEGRVRGAAPVPSLLAPQDILGQAETSRSLLKELLALDLVGRRGDRLLDGARHAA